MSFCYNTEFYQHGEMVQILYCQKSPNQTIFDFETKDVEGNVLDKQRHEFDPKGILLKASTFSTEGELVEEKLYKYRNELLVKIETRGASQEVLSEAIFEYNRMGKQIKMETRSSSGDLLAMEMTEYDKEGRKIEERSFYGASAYSNASEAHFLFSYEDE